MSSYCLSLFVPFSETVRAPIPQTQEILVDETPQFGKCTFEPHYEKTNILHIYAKTKVQVSFAVTVKLTSTFIFATQCNSSTF